MSALPFTLPQQVALDGSGDPLPGAKLFFYTGGTLTLQDTYTTKDLDTPHDNPVVADASGRFEPIFLNSSLVYRTILKDSADVTIYDEDEINDTELRAPYYDIAAAENSVGATIVQHIYNPGIPNRYGNNTTPGTTDMTTSIQTAIDVVAAAGGGIVRFLWEVYKTSAELVVDDPGIKLVGEGAGDMISVYSSAPFGPTTIIGSHTTGSIIRIQRVNCGVEGMQITSDATREAQSFSVTKCGIRFESTDTGSGLERVGKAWVKDVDVIKQPGDGISLVGDCVGTEIIHTRCSGNKGHGYQIDSGIRTGRSNVARPGIVTIIGGRADRNGGHALAIAQPSAASASDIGYRIQVINFECFYNASDAAVRYGTHEVWGFTTQTTFDECAFGGSSVTTPGDHEGWYLAGTENRVNGCRYIEVSRLGTVGNRAAFETVDFKVDGAHLSNAVTGTIAIGFAITSGAKDVEIRAKSTANITQMTAIGASTDGVWVTEIDGDRIGHRDRFRAGSFNSGISISLEDDTFHPLVFTFDSGDYGYGVIEFSSDAASGQPSKVAFRVGTSPYVTVLYGSASGGTGALTDGTSDGVDGDFNIHAHTDGKLYVKNRTGATRTYEAHISALSTNARLGE